VSTTTAISRPGFSDRADDSGTGSDEMPAWVTEQVAKLPKSELPEGLGMAYRPVWHVRNKLLTAYRAHPTRLEWDAGETLIDDLDSLCEEHAAFAAVDYFVLDHAARCLRMLVGKGHKVLMIVPVHFDVLDRDGDKRHDRA